MHNILLLREPSESAPDRYELAFSKAGYNPISLPVLEAVLTNLSTFRDILLQGPRLQDISGVIVTSKRSCEAFWEALQLVQDEGDEKTGVVGWDAIPFYVVGKTTATALKGVFSSFGHLGLGSPDIRGQSSGSAATLAPFILDDLKERPAKILYLTGDKNRDTLPRILNEGGISLQPLQVYETQGSASFEVSLLSKLPSSRDNNIWWIVYFAPSAAAFVTAILHKYFDFERSQPPTPPTTTVATVSASAASPLWQAKVAAIGPTTSSFLQDALELRVHAMAQKPTPEDLLSSIIRNDSLET